MQVRTIMTKTLAAVLGLFLTMSANADDGAISADAVKIPPNTDVGIEVIRRAAELQAMLKIRPDLDVVDTALVFNNPRWHRTLVWCIGYNANGQVLGRAHTVVPRQGVRFIRASDLSNGIDFLGSARCFARSRVIPSSFIVGVGFSDSPARVVHGWINSEIRFPVVASY